MTPAHRAQLLSRLREPDAPGDQAWVEALRASFSPGGEDTAPLEELLGTIELGLERGESAPEGLRGVLVTLLADWLVFLGERPIGGMGNLAAQARRVLEAQERRLSLVTQNLGKGDAARDLKIMTGYLRAGAAPMYLARVERAHPELVAQARAERARRTDIGPLVEDEALLEALREGGAAREVQSKLDGLLTRVESLEELLESSLDHADPDAALVSAALATYLSRTDDAQRLLVRAARLDADTPAMATMAARLSPVMTRHTLALLLADAAWGNPEEPEHHRTHARALALVAIEVVIHKLNANEDVTLASPTSLHGFDVSGAPARVERLWRCWGGVRRS